MIPIHYLSDKELIQLFLKTQRPIYFDELYKRYYEIVYRKCQELAKNSMDAHDYTHDIFIKVYHKLDRFQHRSNFLTWLYRISVNYCIEQLKLTQRLQSLALDERIEYPLTESQESVAYEEMMRSVERGLETLSPMNQALLRLKYEQGKSIGEIAHLYNITNSAVKMRLLRSREKIQKFYARHY